MLNLLEQVKTRQTKLRQGTASEPAEPRQSTPDKVAEPSQAALSATAKIAQPPSAAGGGCAAAVVVARPLPPLNHLEQVKTRQTSPRQGTASEPASPRQSTPGKVAEPNQATLCVATTTAALIACCGEELCGPSSHR